jgi:PhzF family phenazine biosynthesis protein
MIFEQDVVIVSAFTSNGGGGNPAAVVTDADALSDAAKQAIATQTGLSETAFLSRSTKATYRLDFFTPKRRIAHCGHATVAAFGLLEASGVLPPGQYTKETIDGLRNIRLDRSYAGMQQLPPRYEPISASAVRDALGVSELDIDPRFAPIVVNTGNGFGLVGLRDESVLAGLRPNLHALDTLSEQHDLVGFYPFVAGSNGSFDAVTRMFAPRYGINEEAATGMAAGPLACLLHRAGIVSDIARISQGALMPVPSPSSLEVRLTISGDAIVDVLAGGSTSVMGRRVVRYTV